MNVAKIHTSFITEVNGSYLRKMYYGQVILSHDFDGC